MLKRPSISGIFGESPMRPLQAHMDKVAECVHSLIPFFAAVREQNWDEMRRLQKRIAALEHEADDLKHELRLKLPKSLFLPVPRNELLDLLTVQDHVANNAKDIAGLITGREMRFPKSVREPLEQFVARSVDAVDQAQRTVSELDELVEAGFHGKEVDLVESMINELDRIEKDTDNMQIAIRATLFKEEKNLPPVDVMFIYKVIDGIGELGDRAQRVGSRLQLLLAR